jgi:hypothetical protein
MKQPVCGIDIPCELCGRGRQWDSVERFLKFACYCGGAGIILAVLCLFALAFGLVGRCHAMTLEPRMGRWVETNYVVRQDTLQANGTVGTWQLQDESGRKFGVPAPGAVETYDAFTQTLIGWRMRGAAPELKAGERLVVLLSKSPEAAEMAIQHGNPVWLPGTIRQVDQGPGGMFWLGLLEREVVEHGPWLTFLAVKGLEQGPGGGISWRELGLARVSADSAVLVK